jgi:anthranilate synthase component II
MIVVIDNYDSFTYNLVHYLGELGARVRVHRNDKIAVDEALDMATSGVVLSPGPCTPNEAGICLDLVRAAAERRVPLFGVCLGLQSIGQTFGGKVVRAPVLLHGKVSQIRHHGGPLFEGVPKRFSATRYHSLVVERKSLPETLTVTAEDETGLIMGLAHKELPIHGVQFHPESIASEHGHKVLKNFLTLAERWLSAQPQTALA